MGARMHIASLVGYRQKIFEKIKTYRRQLYFGLATLLGLGIIGLFLPQTILYSFSSSSSCQTSPRLLPQLWHIKNEGPFKVERPGSITIGRLQLYSHRVCASAQAPPYGQQQLIYKERLFGWPFLGHTLQVKTPALPSLHKVPSSQLLPPEGNLKIGLDQPDNTFSYVVQSGEHSADCSRRHTELACDLKPLRLAYAQTYDLRIVRQFANKPVAPIGKASVKTLTPVTVAASSIAAGAEVQQKPSSLTLQLDKKLQRLGNVSLLMKKPDGSTEPFPSTAQLQDQTVTVTFGKELPRKTTFEVQLSNIAAEDGSGLVGNFYSLAFSTSGGPRVTGASIGSRNVSTDQPITVHFSQPLLAAQDASKLVSLLIGGKPHPITVTPRGSSMVITLQTPLPLCTPFTIRVAAEVQSQYGVSGDAAWAFNSRAICYATFSIGTSVHSRSITAYQFGSGANPIVYMGAMHGNEANSRAVMMDWFNELNANPGRLPGRSLVVIPAVSPDGLASGSRLNANGVDLNRNFPAADWKSVVTSPDNPQPSPAGGPHPLSEPESRAVASYIQRVQPRVVFSFHSAAAVVEANEAGDSISIASTYASKARYRAVPKSQSAPVFKYDTTGAMEDWMRDRLGRPAIVVELLSKTANEFSRNRDALWYTTGL